MRKILLPLFFAPLFALGQTIKFNAGASASTLIYPSALEIKTGAANILAGFTATAGMDYAETQWGFISSNIGYIQKGRKDKLTYTDPLGNEIWSGTSRVKLNYITFNTTVNVTLSRGALIPFFSIGPRVDYLLNQKDFTDPGDIKFAYGLNGGLGVLKRTGRVEIGGRLDYLLNVAKHPNDRTGTAQLFFGYRLK